ncbi:hypothetical protein HNP84_004157 [Thermocatellispora tengchongensis]|uniref:Protein kinase domain-containing protein n=2 Tax=Thermocatellispora tengchongensis TaxID=1073253 RepID=A0A840PEG4_9ACTN|nr:hypothetical protein [Thermocatellispora tengchongensis]MBB5134425.1 hypothetical protein [Thermocatellispora tengchongensis]
MTLETAFTGSVVQRDGLIARACRLGDGTSAVVLTPERPGSAALGRVVAIGARLAAQYAFGAYPPQLAMLVGHDRDLAVLAQEGRPLDDITLTEAQKDAAALDLLIGLRELADSRVVHRAICPRSLLWDGESLQIADYSQAVVVGEDRPPGSPVPAEWRSPADLAGGGRASLADDLHSACQVLFWLYSGEPPEPEPARMRERLAHHLPGPLDRLAGAYDGPAAPDLRELLRRWSPPPPPRPPAHLARAAEADRRFAAMRAAQLADRAPLIDPATVRVEESHLFRPFAPPPMVLRRFRSGCLLAAAAVVALCVALVSLILGWVR